MRDLNPNFLPSLELNRPIVISGPCSAETEEQLLDTARQVAAQGVKIFRAGIWKPRTKPGGFEGVGQEALAWMQRVREETGMLLAVEVATAEHVKQALDAKIDVLWIGARTSANPFAVQEVADALVGADVAVLVKNPISPDLDLWMGALQRIHNAGITRLGAIHRGFSSLDKSVYRNQPLWSIPIELHRQYPTMPLFCDPSHIGGKRELIAPLCQQAMDLGFSGLIIESHCNPDAAWSDAAQQLTPESLGDMLKNLIVRETMTQTEDLTELRLQIDKLDSELLELMSKRMEVSRKIGLYKKANGMPILQANRYDEILEKREAAAREMGLNGNFIRHILQAIHQESVQQQVEL